MIVVQPNQNFRGLPYGYWAGQWWKWLLSKEPDVYQGDMLFLRGNVDYKPLGGLDGVPRHVDPRSIYDRTGERGEGIWEGTPLFFPVLNAMFWLGGVYDGIKMENEEDIRTAARKDILEGGFMWANIRRKNEPKPRKIVSDMNDYLIESPEFSLTVPRNSTLRDKMEYSLCPGEYQCVTVGYYLLISYLSPSTYRIEFGGKGRGNYYTKASYDIAVYRIKSQPSLRHKTEAVT
jgi:hypothetical protein